MRTLKLQPSLTSCYLSVPPAVGCLQHATATQVSHSSFHGHPAAFERGSQAWMQFYLIGCHIASRRALCANGHRRINRVSHTAPCGTQCGTRRASLRGQHCGETHPQGTHESLLLTARTTGGITASFDRYKKTLDMVVRHRPNQPSLFAIVTCSRQGLP